MKKRLLVLLASCFIFILFDKYNPVDIYSYFIGAGIAFFNLFFLED